MLIASDALMLNQGYTVDSGIPSHVICTLVSNEYIQPRLKAALALSATTMFAIRIYRQLPKNFIHKSNLFE
ncbi:Uncharacterised protein [Chlamydia abortus]|nr:Uncharacterised protein [Chlamydia abortus]